LNTRFRGCYQLPSIAPAGDSASTKTFWDEALASAAHTFGKDSVRFKRLLKCTTNPAEQVRNAAD
jgi:hypothetical protein